MSALMTYQIAWKIGHLYLELTDVTQLGDSSSGLNIYST